MPILIEDQPQKRKPRRWLWLLLAVPVVLAVGLGAAATWVPLPEDGYTLVLGPRLIIIDGNPDGERVMPTLAFSSDGSGVYFHWSNRVLYSIGPYRP